MKRFIEGFADSAFWKFIQKNKFIYEAYQKTFGGILHRYLLKDRIQEVQNGGMQIIDLIQKSLESSEIKFFVDNGTMLGFVRDGRLIKWDYDVDFGVLVNSTFNWSMLEKLLTENGFYLHHQFKKDNIITEQTYGYGTIMIDFFGHFENGDSTSFYTYYREPDKAYDSENKMSVNEIRTRKISDTKILLLQDAKVYILENSEGYLEDLYGKSWRVPNPNWVNGSGPCCHKLNDIYGYYEKCIEK